jgi:hypothetical protein
VNVETLRGRLKRGFLKMDIERKDDAPGQDQMSDENFTKIQRAWCHAANIGRIVLALADHDIGDIGDCSINSPIVSIIDRGEPARVLLQALADMSEETAAGICKQL